MSKVEILWYAIPNGNTRVGGWLPVIDENGKQRGDTWWHRGYDLAEAERMAKTRADELAEKFVGDWNVTVAKKTTGAGAPAAKLDAEINAALLNAPRGGYDPGYIGFPPKAKRTRTKKAKA